MVDIERSSMSERVADVRARIAEAAARSGRPADSVTLVGVSKFQPIEALFEARACGIEILGENRVQERASKADAWQGPDVVWHMIGHLQRNKAKLAAKLFDCVESVDSIELATILDRAAGELGRILPVMIEINTSGEASKSGAAPDACLELVEAVASSCRSLKVEGLMTIGPLTDDERRVRASFATLRELAERARARTGLAMPHLSMGMSGDFEWAIEEGSTIVRVGTSIFGARHL